MSILQKQRSRDPRAGYARDFVDMIAAERAISWTGESGLSPMREA